ncbi:MAG: hypothetical protein EOO43_14830 [Flavobacterium sp.]|nr:MAG: hypothetical protein EOO43_14830 [Flavobacterium sp.]
MEDKTKHLDFILKVIDRMSSNSFLLKGWTVTLNAAVIALVVKDEIYNGWLIGLVSGYLFWIIDAYYLSIERKFRQLYDKVRQDNETDFMFTLDVKEFNDKKSTIYGSFTSLNLALFYGLILISNVLLHLLL